MNVLTAAKKDLVFCDKERLSQVSDYNYYHDCPSSRSLKRYHQTYVGKLKEPKQAFSKAKI